MLHCHAYGFWHVTNWWDFSYQCPFRGDNFNRSQCWVPAKRSQNVKATYGNTVGRNMLHTFGHPVAPCCDMLGVVSSSLTIFKLELTTPNMSHHGTTGWPNAHSMLRPTILRCVGWHDAIVWLQVWPSSNLSQQHPARRNTAQQGGQTRAACRAQQCCDMLLWHAAIADPNLHVPFRDEVIWPPNQFENNLYAVWF